ncbi:2392_t:CDS:1, partial [Entrophospora sp. SA101]
SNNIYLQSAKTLIKNLFNYTDSPAQSFNDQEMSSIPNDIIKLNPYEVNNKSAHINGSLKNSIHH